MFGCTCIFREGFYDTENKLTAFPLSKGCNARKRIVRSVMVKDRNVELVKTWFELG